MSPNRYDRPDSSSSICVLHFSLSLLIVAIDSLPGSVNIFCREFKKKQKMNYNFFFFKKSTQHVTTLQLVISVFVYNQYLSYLHKRMTVQSESSTGHLFEALADIGQGASSQDLRLVVHDESQGNTEKNLGALVEKTIPDPQNCLPAKDTRNGCNVTHFSRRTFLTCVFSLSKHNICSPQLGGCQCRGR